LKAAMVMTLRLALLSSLLVGLGGGLVGLVGARAQSSSLLPTPVSGEARMVTFDYDEDRIYKVLIRPKNTTQLKFGAAETVTYVSAGDRSDFIVTVPSSRAFLEVKPKWEGVSTNLLVVTTLRTYHIDLQSTGEGRKWYTRVAWNYEDARGLDASAAAAEGANTALVRQANPAAGGDVISRGIDLARMNSAYEVEGDAAFRPAQVFDDGTHTYIRLPEHLQELPALFMLTPDTGETALVNYAVNEPWLVVPRTMDRFLLQLGKARVVVRRTTTRRGFWSLFGMSPTASAAHVAEPAGGPGAQGRP
jgi:type IV secretion system protein VirB9